ncbi:HET-domain-containing protein [Xylaria venustula]|nr:HET-domain-containing protein [Xylaria venustula]
MSRLRALGESVSSIFGHMLFIAITQYVNRIGELFAFHTRNMSSSTDSDDSGSDEFASPKLQDRITELCTVDKLSDGHKKFLPNNAIDHLVTEKTIIGELDKGIFRDRKQQSKDKLIEWILKDAKRLFLIHIRSRLGPDDTFRSLRQFMKQGFTDGKLPIDFESADRPFNACFTKNYWTPSSRELFSDSQWTFLSPMFKNVISDYHLQSRHILPFIEKDSQCSKAGAFSAVYKVTIHEAHRDHAFNQRNNVPSMKLVRDTITQLEGLADALTCLHIYNPDQSSQAESQNSTTNLDSDFQEGKDAKLPGNQSIRHGDLKPENILRFLDGKVKNSNRSTSVGTLKIADMGLAKRHVVATQYRVQGTSTRYGTALYEAPEVRQSVKNEARSRLYDVWSMGCIMFEFVLWILYGNDMITELHNRLKKGSNQYFEIQNGTAGPAQVHRTVVRWIQYLQQNDPDCKENSPIGDLLKLIKTKLLVINLPPRGRSGGNEQLPPGAPFPQPPAGEDKTNYRWQSSLKTQVRDVTLNGETTRTTKADYTLPPLEGWEYPVDNDFAGKATSQLDTKILDIRSRHSRLCERCLTINFWKGGFAIEDKVENLYGRSRDCAFCEMLWNAHRKFGIPKALKVRFERHQSMLKLSGTEHPLPIFSILKSPKLHTPLPIQIGFPRLPQHKASLFFSLLNLWLRDCDDNHKGCEPPRPITLPTRLIDVGTIESPQLRLLETRDERIEGQRYIALSHPWGDEKNHPPFSTLRKDPNGQGRELAEFKKAMPWGQFPRTFRDAVITTRALNTRYLWIDSLCIIQGEDGDFSEEAKRMEDVFSCAYCVLAASRATGQHDGFLQSIEERKYITFPGDGVNPFYICENIDNFSGDVLEGSLNTRGWVLQERALARRTIFFTERQAYFECGKGVRCQSLTTMHNNMADFLGDPNFPHKAIGVQRGLRIRFFQDLYKQYSRLSFTHIADRPFAIEGLENRLRAAYETDGAFGIFDDGPGKGLFHRSLLWQRGEDELDPGLTRIVFPPGRRVAVPTWSWMAYHGGIDYVDPPFDQTIWEKEDIHPPRMKDSTTSSHTHARMELLATVRRFNVAGHLDGEVRLVYDTEKNQSDGTRPQCVVIAKSREGQTPQEKKFYVLLVSLLSSYANGSDHIYERVGAGVMLGRFILFDEPGEQAKIR